MIVTADKKNKHGFAWTKAKRTESAFTLIELLVVISIIGVLIGIATVSFSGSQKKARDARRKSDLKYYQSALEFYANKNNGYYPMFYTAVNLSGVQLCEGSLALSNCPSDPKYEADESFYYYRYQSDGTLNSGTATATRYVLWSVNENTGGYWAICSSGSVLDSATKPTLTTCQ